MQKWLKKITIITALTLIAIGAVLTTTSRNSYNKEYLVEKQELADQTPEGGSEQCEATDVPDFLAELDDFAGIDFDFESIKKSPISPAKRLINVGIMTLIIIFGTILFHTRRKYRWQLLLMTATLIYFGFLNHGCICPVGSTGHVANAVAHYGEVRLSTEAVLLFFVPLIVSLFFGRIFCGSACPLGAIQEIVGRWETKIPKSLNKVLGLARLLVLIWLIVGAIMFMTLPICQYDPFVKIFRFSADTAGWLYAGGFLLLTITVKRPFCRFLCPYGLILGIFAKIGFKTRKIIAEKCVSCNKCVKACPVNCISLPKIDSFNCVCCGKCSQICPTKAIK